jgi:hypothetical protein
MATIVLLPLEDHIPTVAGFSALFIMFGVLAGYVFLNCPRALARIWLHPVFLAAYTLFFLAFLFESTHPDSRYRELISFGLMVTGAVFVASLCRDKQALRASIYGYMVGSLWLSILLFLTTYGALQGAVATDYNEASRVRIEVSGNVPLEGNLNNMAFLTAQGGVVGLALTLTARSALRRTLFLGITLFCLVATFLPMSRGGIVIAASSCVTILWACRAKRMQAIVVAIILGVNILTLVPDAVFSRVGALEGGRTELYMKIIEYIPQYMTIGVGAGNYEKSWAHSNGFTTGAGDALGTHNVFLHVTICWGLAALLAFLALIWQAYCCLPKQCGDDALTLCLLGLGVSLLLQLMFSHAFYDKWYSLWLGLLVGARSWIWPTGILQPAARKQRHVRPNVVHAS